MFDKNQNILMLEKDISVGQDSKTGLWRTKNINARTPEEADILIEKMTAVCNKHNKEMLSIVEPETKPKKEKKQKKQDKSDPPKELIK